MELKNNQKLTEHLCPHCGKSVGKKIETISEEALQKFFDIDDGKSDHEDNEDPEQIPIWKKNKSEPDWEYWKAFLIEKGCSDIKTAKIFIARCLSIFITKGYDSLDDLISSKTDANIYFFDRLKPEEFDRLFQAVSIEAEKGFDEKVEDTKQAFESNINQDLPDTSVKSKKAFIEQILYPLIKNINKIEDLPERFNVLVDNPDFVAKESTMEQLKQSEFELKECLRELKKRKKSEPSQEAPEQEPEETKETLLVIAKNILGAYSRNIKKSENKNEENDSQVDFLIKIFPEKNIENIKDLESFEKEELKKVIEECDNEFTIFREEQFNRENNLEEDTEPSEPKSSGNKMFE